MICENCHENKAISFYHAKNVCEKCFKEMLEGDKAKRRFLLKQRSGK